MSENFPPFPSSSYPISSLHNAGFFQGRAHGYVLIFTVALEGTVLIASSEIHLLYSLIKFSVQW